MRLRYTDGLNIYQRHDPDLPGHNDNMRFLERLHGFEVPFHVPSYAAPISTDFWDASENPESFEHWWTATEAGPAWEQVDR